MLRVVVFRLQNCRLSKRRLCSGPPRNRERNALETAVNCGPFGAGGRKLRLVVKKPPESHTFMSSRGIKLQKSAVLNVWDTVRPS